MSTWRSCPPSETLCPSTPCKKARLHITFPIQPSVSNEINITQDRWNTTEGRTRMKMGFCKCVCFPAGSFSSSWPGWLRTRRCQWSSCMGRWSGTREKGWARGQREVFSRCCSHHRSFLFNIDSASGATPVTVFSIVLLLSNTSLLSMIKVNCLCVWKETQASKETCENMEFLLLFICLFFTNYLLHYLLFHVRLSLLVPEGIYEAEMLMSKVEHQCKDVFPITRRKGSHGLMAFCSAAAWWVQTSVAWIEPARGHTSLREPWQGEDTDTTELLSVSEYLYTRTSSMELILETHHRME